MARAVDPDIQDFPVKLKRGNLNVRLFKPQDREPRAMVVFGSGDGGWSGFEELIGNWLCETGCAVAGVDLHRYAETDYDAPTLQADMATISAEALARIKRPELPLVYGGWSMGAVQAIPAAAGKNRPPTLCGFLLLSPDSRGRFGLRPGDLVGITPKGKGTFSLTDYSAAVADLRVAQFYGTADFMGSTAWIRTLKSPSQLYEMAGANHGFDGPSESFKPILQLGVEWVLGDDSATASNMEHLLPFGLSPLWPATVLAIGLAIFFVISRKHSLFVLAAAVAVFGAIDLTEAMFVKPPSVLAWMEQWLPLSVSSRSRLMLLLSGVALLSIARGLKRRKRMAWWLAVTLLAASAILHLSRAFDWHHSFAALVLLVPLIRWRKEFIALSDAPSLHLAWRLAVVVILALWLYGTFSLRAFSERGAFGEGLTWGECATVAASAAFAQTSDLDLRGNREARDFLTTLRAGGLCGALITLILLLRPVIVRRKDEHDQDEDRVRALIAAHGRDPMDEFALLPDKRYFFGTDGNSVVAYVLWRNYAVALADPIAPDEVRASVVGEFTAFCSRQDWVPVFYCAHVSNRAMYELAGLATLKIGEDARISLADFVLTGNKFQNLRTPRNKARKEGTTFQWYDASPPDHGLEAQLQLISKEWLESKHGSEMAFDLGAFSIDWIRRHGCAVIRNAEGRVECFATWNSYAKGTGRCIDLMRSRPDVRGIMDFLIVEAIDFFKAQGVVEVSLGNAPLANTETDLESMNRRERAVKFLFEHFDQIYGYKSLFDFKRKYYPDWQGRYIAYPAKSNIASIGLAVAGVHLPRGFMGLLKS